MLSRSHLGLGRLNLKERLELLRTPGISVAVVRDGKLEWAVGWGVREAGTMEPVTPETMFQACSISKPVTAAAALRLADRGLLDIDQDVNRYLTTWQVPGAERVTLRQLLSHTAGVTAQWFPGYRRDQRIPTAAEILDGGPGVNTPAVRVDTPPGTQFRYSGGGYVVVQQVLADVTGMPFPVLMEELVFAPLEMNHSTFAQPLPEAFWAGAATGHEGDGGPILGKWLVYPELAAAGLWTTPTDLMRLALAIQACRAGRSAFLSQALVGEMLTRQNGGPYGLGFSLEGEGEGLRFSHSGSNDGFKAHLVAFAEKGVGAAVMCNGDLGVMVEQEVLQVLAEEYGVG